MVKKMQVVGERGRLFAQLAVAGLVMVALIALSDSFSASQTLERPRHRPSSEKRAASKDEEGVAKEIGALFAGIPQRGAVLGNPSAPVTLQFFADLECRQARRFVLGALPLLIRKWVRSGKLRIEYRANQEETIWADIYIRQQVAVLAAGRQERAWQYLDFFYHKQGPEFTRYAINHFLRAIAKDVPGLDLDNWTADGHDPQLVQQVTGDGQAAQARQIVFTPAFLIGPTGGDARRLLHFTFTETAAFDEAIEKLLS